MQLELSQKKQSRTRSSIRKQQQQKMNALGFYNPFNKRIIEELTKIKPQGGNAYRDSTIKGCQLISQVYLKHQRQSQQNNWQYVQILIIDGGDTSSRLDKISSLNYLSIIEQNMNLRRLKLFIVGIKLSLETRDNLETIRSHFNLNVEFFSIDKKEIIKTLRKIRESIMNSRNQENCHQTQNYLAKQLIPEKQQVFKTYEAKHYVFLFNICASQSMKSQQKWYLVRKHVHKFVKELDENDLVSIVVFNDKVQVIGAKEPEEKSAPHLVVEDQEKEKEEGFDLPIDSILKKQESNMRELTTSVEQKRIVEKVEQEVSQKHAEQEEQKNNPEQIERKPLKKQDNVTFLSSTPLLQEDSQCCEIRIRSCYIKAGCLIY